jgi:hypothetical protein
MAAMVGLEVVISINRRAALRSADHLTTVRVKC